MRLGLGLSLSNVRGGAAAPVAELTSFDYSIVDAAGGDSVTITGTDLADASACTVGGTSATITAQDATTLTFTVPAKTAGTYDVVVTTAGGDSNAISLELFDMAGLSPDGHWRVPYSGSPLVGVAGGNLSEATNPPSAGASLNGKGAVVDHDGTNDHLLGTALSNFHGTGQFAGCMLVYVDSIGTNSATPQLNDTLLCSSGTTQLFLSMRSNGTLYFGIFEDAFGVVTVSATIATGAWTRIQWRKTGATTGTKLELRTNGGTWQSVASTRVVNSLAALLNIGRNTGFAEWADFKWSDLWLSKTTRDDTTMDKIDACMRARYGL